MSIVRNNLSPGIPGDSIVVERDVMVRMRDGVRLATDIYRPARDGVPIDEPLPVILERTPYDKTGTSRSEISLANPEPMDRATLAGEFVQEGYVVVWQDCRGRYRSGGGFVKYVNEGEDGADTIAWLRNQPWCDGRVATMGLSYGAHTQMALACHGPKGLSAMLLDSGGFSNAFSCGIRQGGAFELKQATWAYNRALEGARAERDPLIRRAIAAEPLEEWFREMPWSEARSPVRWDPDYENYLLGQWRAGTFDDGWKKIGLWAAGYYDRIPDMPVMLMSSWYDAYVETTLQNYEGLKSQMSYKPVLVMGPWTHGNRTKRVFGDTDFGPAAVFDGNVADDWLSCRKAWFAAALKNRPLPDNTPVRLFVMGGGTGRKTQAGHLDHGGHWIRTTDWPPPEVEPLTLYLRPDMALATTPPDEDHHTLSYRFDLHNPVPTIGGALTSGEPIFTGGGFDQVEQEAFFGCTRPGLPLSARRDVLSFETPPLDEDLTVLGPVTVKLWVSTDAPDTDFTAKLLDVYPPSPDYPRGYTLNLTDGIFRLRYRESFERPRLVEPGEGPLEITIKPFATANLFRAGHRLRLDVSSSNFPKFDVNPNTGAPEGTSRVWWTCLNSVLVDAVHPSKVELMRLDV